MKVLAVGDIHTKKWIVDKVDEIADNYDKVVLIGDYADEWKAKAMDNIDIWRAVRELEKKHGNVTALIGNHDYSYALTSNMFGGRISEITYFILKNPENKDLAEWVSNLPVHTTIDNVTYSHAGITEKWLDSSRKLTLNCGPLWVRPTKFTVYAPGKQVFGHTPSKTCREVRPGVWCIDTFSKDPYGRDVGDHTVLEIIDGKEFNVIKL